MCESCAFVWLLVAIPVVIVLMVIVTVIMVALEERCQRRNKHTPCLTECLETHIFEHRTSSGTQLRQRMVVKCTHEAARQGGSSRDLGSSDGAEGDEGGGIEGDEECRVGVAPDYLHYGANATRAEELKCIEGGEDVEDAEGMETLESGVRESAESNEDSVSSEDNMGRDEEALYLGSESSDACEASEESEDMGRNDDESQEASLTNSGSDEADDDRKIRVILKHRGKPSHRLAFPGTEAR